MLVVYRLLFTISICVLVVLSAWIHIMLSLFGARPCAPNFFSDGIYLVNNTNDYSWHLFWAFSDRHYAVAEIYISLLFISTAKVHDRPTEGLILSWQYTFFILLMLTTVCISTVRNWMDSEQCLNKSLAIQILAAKNTEVRNPRLPKLGSGIDLDIFRETSCCLNSFYPNWFW